MQSLADTEIDAKLAARVRAVIARGNAAVDALGADGVTMTAALAVVAPAVRESGGVLGEHWTGYNAIASAADGPASFEPARAYPIVVGLASTFKVVWLIVLESGGYARVQEDSGLQLAVIELTGHVIGAAERNT